MRYLLLLALMAVLARPSMADVGRTSNRPDYSPRIVGGNPAWDGREGGEDIGTAFVIPGDVTLLPFHDTGATCDNTDDYDEVCPYAGTASADVVYSFTPSLSLHVNVDLCASIYDTKVFIYDANQNVIACNDDACGTRSFLYDIPLTGGRTYYFVVDGYGGDCGAYDLFLERREDCVVPCPVGGQVEGEPPCADDYRDVYNGGCNSPNLVWQPINPDASGCATLCGKGCAYLYHGLSYRDTDWFEATAVGGRVTVSCEGEFPLMLALINFADCHFPDGAFVYTQPCVPAECSLNFSPGATVWILVTPSQFQGVIESDYIFTACGLVPRPVPAEPVSWGKVKVRYR